MDIEEGEEGEREKYIGEGERRNGGPREVGEGERGRGRGGRERER